MLRGKRTCDTTCIGTMDGLTSLLLLLIFQFLLLPVCLLLATPVILLVACFQAGPYLDNVRSNYEWLHARLQRVFSLHNG